MHRKGTPRNRTKHQHWVPQFYLRYFATPETRDSDKPQIWIFSKDAADGDEKLTSVRNVCGKRYLYSPRKPNGERTWEFDDRLNDLESLVSQLWPPLATDFVNLADQHIRKALALFVSVMHFRHPSIRQSIEEIHKQLIAVYEAVLERANGTRNPESVEVEGEVCELDTADWNSYRNWTQDDHDRAFAEFVQSNVMDMAEHLLGKRWSVVFSEANCFVTTDKPVVLQHQTRQRFGFRTSGTIVFFR